jgi:hypothetical protein
MSLAKNLGGRGGVKKNLKILLQICDNPEGSKTFCDKMAFFSQKSKKFLHSVLNVKDSNKTHSYSWQN